MKSWTISTFLKNDATCFVDRVVHYDLFVISCNINNAGPRTGLQGYGYRATCLQVWTSSVIWGYVFDRRCRRVREYRRSIISVPLTWTESDVSWRVLSIPTATAATTNTWVASKTSLPLTEASTESKKQRKTQSQRVSLTTVGLRIWYHLVDTGWGLSTPVERLAWHQPTTSR